MTTIKDVLQAADPLRHESPLSPHQRDRARRSLLAASTTTDRPRSARSSIVLTAIIVLTVIGALFSGSHIWPHGAGTLQAAVRFEVRLAEDVPGPDLLEARVQGSNRSVYLHEETIVDNSDIAQAKVVQGEGPYQFAISVEFNAAGAQKIHAATASHLGKRVAILIDNEVVMAPVVKSPIDTSAMITGGFTAAEAGRIVRGIGFP